MKRTSHPSSCSTEDFQRLIHDLNQSLKREWDRAERLQAELSDIRASRVWRLVSWFRKLKSLFRSKQSAKVEDAFLETPIVDLAEAPAGEVSIIVPFRDQPGLLKNLLRSLRITKYKCFEIILVDNGSTCPRTLRLLHRLQERRRCLVLADPSPFNFSRLCNLGARHAAGDFLLFLNNDTRITEPYWLDHLLRLAASPGVGVAGATLLYPDGTIQHAGLYPAGQGRWAHPHRGQPADWPGSRGELKTPRTVPAVTGACLMIARDLFQAVGRFDENYPVTGNDVDLCRRVRAQGFHVAVTPFARLVHFECLSRGYERDMFRS